MIKLENLLIAFYGLTTVVVFIAMIISGGLFDSINTILFREVSFLISPYSLKSDITIPLYRVYNAQLFMFAIVLFVRMQNTFARLGALYLSMSALVSIFLIKFPMDPLGTSQSLSGSRHILLVFMAGFYIAIALALFGYAFKKSKNLTILSTYSTEISLTMLSGGFATVIFALLSMPAYVGLIEKLPIAAFLGWLLVTSVMIIRSDRRVKYTAKLK